MKRILLIVLAFIFLAPINAQKDLTIQESVLGQYRQFRPDMVMGFEWTGKSKTYAYLDKYTTLVIEKVGGKEVKRIAIATVNEKLGTQFFYFAGLSFVNEHTIALNNGKVVAIYDLDAQKGFVFNLPENAANATFDNQFKHVAYTLDNNLFIADVQSQKVTPITDFEDGNIVSGQSIARNEMGIKGGIFWSPNGNYLAFYQKDESNVHDYPLLNINEYPGTLQSIKYPMAGQGSEKPKVGIYNLASKETHYLSPKHGEDNYLTNLSWTPDEKMIVLAEVARSQDHIWVKSYNTKAEFQQLFFEEEATTWVEPERPAYFPNEENNNFVWVSERNGFDNLYYYDEKGTLIRQLTENNFPLKEIVTINDGEVYFTATGENPLNTLLYKVDLEGNQKLLTQNEGTHQAAISPDGKYIFDQYSAHNIPNIAQIIDAKGRVKDEVLNSDDKLKAYELAEAEIKVLKNKEGTELYTRMIKPKDFDSTQQYPVLIYVYGGPHAQLITNSWLDGASLWMYWMANQGYIVFTLDNRGSGNRGVAFEHVIHRKLGVAAHEDQMVGVDYLKSLPYVDNKRLAVHGWSFGGFMTGTMLLKSPEVFNVGVAGGAVTDWKFYEVMYGERYMDTPEENPEGYQSTSLINQADQLQGKLLLIHGTVDPVVVMQHSLSLVKKFVELGIQMDFFPYPMHEHNVYGKDRVHLMTKVLNYIIENNQ